MSLPLEPIKHVIPRRCLALAALLLMSFSLSGCSVLAWLTHGVAGGERRTKVKAEYPELANQRVAVLVAADSRTLYRAPQSREKVCRAVASYLAEHLPTATLMNPREVVRYQADNPHWATVPPGRLLDELAVDRLVLIDLAEYRLHERGNRHLARGVLTANVTVHAADADDPDNPDYYQTVTTRYPEDSTVGVVNADAQSIELGMIQAFGMSVARLFHDHEITQ